MRFPSLAHPPALEQTLEQQQQRLAYDYPIVVGMKQGFVEVRHAADFDPSYSPCVLIGRERIDTLNSTIRALGTSKVILRFQINFKLKPSCNTGITCCLSRSSF